MLLDFLLGKPFKFSDAQFALGEVSLASEDPAFQEECLFAEKFRFWLGGVLGLSEVFDNVADWMIADHPGVHVGPGRLEKASLTSLKEYVSRVPLTRKAKEKLV